MKVLEPTPLRVLFLAVACVALIWIPIAVERAPGRASAPPGTRFSLEQAALIEPLAWLQTGDYDRAEVLLTALTGARPEMGEAWCLLGSCALARGAAEQAIDCLRRGLDLMPATLFQIIGHTQWAAAAARLARSDEAWDHAMQALRLDPDCLPALELGASLARDRGATDEERRLLERLVQSRLDHPQAGQWRARMAEIEAAPRP